MLVTYLGQSGYCPHIQNDVTLSGKYGKIEDTTFKFISFTCPIAENAKLHPHDQSNEYLFLSPCENIQDCPIAKNFKGTVTL